MKLRRNNEDKCWRVKAPLQHKQLFAKLSNIFGILSPITLGYLAKCKTQKRNILEFILHHRTLMKKCIEV